MKPLSVQRPGSSVDERAPLVGGKLPPKRWNPCHVCLYSTCLSIFIAGAIVTIIMLSLPETYTCDPAGSSSYYVVEVDMPAIQMAMPSTVCAKGNMTVTLVGTSFYTVGNQQPTVTCAHSFTIFR